MRVLRLTVCVPTLGIALALMALAVPASATDQGRAGVIAYAIGGGELDWIVRTVKPDGTQDRRLIGPRTTNWPLPFPRGLSGPRWSPDGRRLLLGGHHHYDDGPQSLWYSTASGKRVTRIPLRLGGVGKRGMFLFGWDWAPDSRHVVFAAARGQLGRPTIYTISIDGKRRTALRRGWWPKWSSDGRHIVFTSRMDPTEINDRVGPLTEIATMRRDGSRFRRLTESSYDADPSISPDGRSVLFVRHFGTVPFFEHPESWRDEWRIVDISGRHEVLIATRYAALPGTGTPSPTRYCPPQWTPDGTGLATVRSDPGTEPDRAISRFVTFDLTGADERAAFDFRFGGPCDFSWQPQ